MDAGGGTSEMASRASWAGDPALAAGQWNAI